MITVSRRVITTDYPYIYGVCKLYVHEVFLSSPMGGFLFLI